jgi:tRNA(fMet)-specific endonuclease VapC
VAPGHARGILDTSVVVLLGQFPEDALPAEPMITSITLAELAVGPLVARQDEERVLRQARLQQTEADFVALPFDAEAARAFGAVSASLRRVGRKTAARAYDSMIAAIAIANDLPIYTCNPDDFTGIERLEVIAVPVPG